MNIQTYEEHEEVHQKIKAHLAEKAEWLSENWLEAYEDLVNDQFAEELISEPDVVVDRLVRELDDTNRKLYTYLSGEEIVTLLRSKLTDRQIVETIIYLGSARESKPTSYLTISSWNPRAFEEEIFVEMHKDLANLVKILPDGNEMKVDAFMVDLHVGPFYFCTRADDLLKKLEQFIDDALIDESLQKLLKT